MPRNIEMDRASKLRLRAADLQRLALEAKHEGAARELDQLALHYLALAQRLEIAQRLSAWLGAKSRAHPPDRESRRR